MLSDVIIQRVRDFLVEKGPPKITVEDFHNNESGSRFPNFQSNRTLPNDEIVYIPWLI